jgi:denticleless
MFDASRPERGPLGRFDGHAAHSFYVKVAFSPDGTHVASGSCDKRVYIWQADRPQDGPYALEGHNGEARVPPRRRATVTANAHAPASFLALQVTGVDWSSGDFGRLASCADDGSLRVWSINRPDVIPRRTVQRRAPAVAAAAAAAAAAAVAVDAAAAPQLPPAGGRATSVRSDVDVFAAFATPGPPAAAAAAAAAAALAASDADAMPASPNGAAAGGAADEAAATPLRDVAAELADAAALSCGDVAMPQAPPLEEPPAAQLEPAAAPVAAAPKPLMSVRSITDFFSPVRLALVPADGNRAGGGTGGTQEAAGSVKA